MRRNDLPTTSRDEAALRLFCRCVATIYRIHVTRGYPADRRFIRHFVSTRSPVYYFRISHLLDCALTDPELKESNRQNRDLWTRLLRVRLLGAYPAYVAKLIEALEQQRLLIEYASGRAAFRFGDEAGRRQRELGVAEPVRGELVMSSVR